MIRRLTAGSRVAVQQCRDLSKVSVQGEPGFHCALSSAKFVRPNRPAHEVVKVSVTVFRAEVPDDDDCLRATKKGECGGEKRKEGMSRSNLRAGPMSECERGHIHVNRYGWGR